MCIKIESKNLKYYNTMAIPSVCHHFYIPRSFHDIIDIYTEHTDKMIILLGGGSNTIFSKEYYDESYVFISTELLRNIDDTGDTIQAQCGVTLNKLSWYMLEKQCGGYEFLEDIPGTVGGAVYMNAGTNAGSIGDFIDTITWYDINKNIIVTKKASDEYFGYRSSIFNNNNSVILNAAFRKTEGNYNEILDKILNTKRDRFKKQPRNYANAGSVFKRKYNDKGQAYHIWRLMDAVGLRGFCVGEAMISEKHPGFVVNKGNCTGADVLSLMNIAKCKVSDKFDIILETEWKII